LIICFIFFSNELLIKSVPSNNLYIQWGMIYLSLIMAYISMGAINLAQLGGDIGTGTATGNVRGAGGVLDGAGGSSSGTCCDNKCCP
jgi:hypothetical protein